MRVHKTYLGYWYQRTTLHLSEIYDFLTKGTSPLALNKDKLHELRNHLQVEDVRMDAGVLEVIKVKAIGGIEINIYEDGLVLLANDHSQIKQDIKELTAYFEQRFSPAIAYIFSLGAPVPKELAHIKTVYPYFIVASGGNKLEAAKLLGELGQHQYMEIESGAIEVYRGDTYYIINTKAPASDVEELVGMLVFFREFKSQLHHYLNLHRTVWEQIEDIKEQGHIRGKAVSRQRALLESYRKTIELIEGRIKQMSVYINTRSAIVEKHKWDAYLHDVLEFRYDNLGNTLNYIRSLWAMTKQYLDSAITVFSDINTLSTRKSVQALTIISSVGVVSGVIGFLSEEQLPEVTSAGLKYFGLLLVATVVINQLLRWFYSRIKYKIADVKLADFSNRRR